MSHLTGDWAKLQKLLAADPTGRIKKAMNQAVLKEAHLIRGAVISNIASGGAEAGKPFAPHSPTTLIIRQFRGFGGSKILIQSGTLMAGVYVRSLGNGKVFVGVRRKEAGVNIAGLMEAGGGPYTKPMTAKQRRFLAAAFRAAGQPFGTGGGGGGVIRWRIPARPYFGPVVEKIQKDGGIALRFWTNVAKGLGGDFGKPG